MTSIVIDTNPLAYLYAGIPDLGKKYAALLGNLSKTHTLLIPKIVYGELSLIFRNETDLAGFLADTGIVIAEISTQAHLVAAKRWESYNKRRVLLCHRCSAKLTRLACEKCGSPVRIRQHILSDFLIGAFALEMEGRTLVTHDAGYYTTYFPELKIVTA